MMHAPQGWVPGRNVFAQSWLLSALVGSLAGCATAVDLDERIVGQDQELIYGTDDRTEYGAASNSYRRWADSTAQAVTTNMVNCANGTCTLTSQPWTIDMESSTRLCSTVRYRGQSTLSFSQSNGIGAVLHGVSGGAEHG
jgi:hypothetical protein